MGTAVEAVGTTAGTTVGTAAEAAGTAAEGSSTPPVRLNSRLTVRPMCPPCAFSSSAMVASLATRGRAWSC